MRVWKTVVHEDKHFTRRLGPKVEIESTRLNASPDDDDASRCVYFGRPRQFARPTLLAGAALLR